MSIWSAAVTMPTICGSVGAPPLCAFVPVGSSATANAIATAADKTLLCLIVFDISMFPFLIFLSFDILTSFGHTIRSLHRTELSTGWVQFQLRFAASARKKSFGSASPVLAVYKARSEQPFFVVWGPWTVPGLECKKSPEPYALFSLIKSPSKGFILMSPV